MARAGEILVRAGWAAAGLAWLVAVSVISAEAATIEVRKASGGGATTIITIEGEIKPGDDRRFAAVADGKGDAVVMLNSPGGNVLAGIEMGRDIRRNGYTTLVADGFQCASACGLTWLGGRMRLMAPGETVGFHAAFLADDPKHGADSVGNAVVGAYLNELGLAIPAIAYITEAQPDDIQWLTFDDAKRVGIDVERFIPEKAKSASLGGANQQGSSPSGEGEGSTADTGGEGSSAGDGGRDPSQLAHNRPMQGNGERGGQDENWSAYGDWIQLFSRTELPDAEQLAAKYHEQFKNTRIFSYDNGWYVVVLGPYPHGRARPLRDSLVDSGEIPRDSRVSAGDRFVDLVWGMTPNASE
jgi:hypothetical protein